ncbi:hypothetical protein AOZ06_05230 [Kibdelosporangium phytohabitans]|uniref:Inositol monophosphatase n=2 Tax=Kibdelosporangium phytohabitans TaxID=860235 RepID=A0A0N9HT64_9PSEU|nr:hypothetical protein AOZ06_05230 [Kibdelosporangium phytohabitans]
MNDDQVIPPLAQHIVKVVTSMMTQIQPRLVDAAVARQHGERDNRRHKDNFLSDFDLWMHDHYKERLAKVIPSFVYASEEAEPQIVGVESDPDLCVLVDPLDTSELAVRGLHGYTHVMVYSRSSKRPIIAVVGDIYHHVRFYLAARHDDGVDRAYMITADNRQYTLDRPSDARLPGTLLTSYSMRPDERFLPIARQTRLLDALSLPTHDGKKPGRIGVDFGSVSLCHVAAGFTDATVEIAKGFAIWDLAPGHYILHAAGGTTIDLNGRPITLDYSLNTLSQINETMDGRQKFIAAGNAVLAMDIQRLIDV